jgi:2-polyprenyl-3-methyl-5-hydroxy-6-metoxy-1,4-benzoquinol methylase
MSISKNSNCFSDLEEINCIVCNSNKSSILTRKVRYKQDCTIVRCNKCGFVFMNPQPTDKELGLYYKHKYRLHYGCSVPDKKYKKESKEKANQRYSLLKNIFFKKGALLEVGCGDGEFLKKCESFFNSVEGVEPGETFLNHCREKQNLKMYDNLKNISSKKYDYIVLFHVLEHVKDPLLMLSNLSKLLNEKGKIIIEVPNEKNFWLHTPWAKESFLYEFFQPAHLWYFDNISIRKLIRKSKKFHVNKIFSYSYELPFKSYLLKIISRNIYKTLCNLFYFFINLLLRTENLVVILEAKK